MKKRAQPIVFIASFAVLVIAGLYAVRHAPAPMHSLKLLTANVVGRMIPLVGVPTTVHDTSLMLGGIQKLDIIDECTGIYAAILLGAFILTYPHPWRRRIVTLALALVGVGIVNILRLTLLGLAMHHAQELADFVHDYLWQVLWGAVLVGFAVLYAMSGRRVSPPSRGLAKS